jgi:predicted HTH domain antitoxin
VLASEESCEDREHGLARRRICVAGYGEEEEAEDVLDLGLLES